MSPHCSMWSSTTWTKSSGSCMEGSFGHKHWISLTCKHPENRFGSLRVQLCQEIKLHLKWVLKWDHSYVQFTSQPFLKVGIIGSWCFTPPECMEEKRFSFVRKVCISELLPEIGHMHSCGRKSIWYWPLKCVPISWKLPWVVEVLDYQEDPVVGNICDWICVEDRKKGLPHTTSRMNLEVSNFGLKPHTNLIFPLSINLCWYSLLFKFQGN